MSNFNFNGDWEYDIQLEALEGFQSRNGSYTSKDSNSPSNGIIKLIIEDELSDNPDPTPEQLKTINFILEHQEEIIESIIERTKIELPEIIENYGLEDEPQFKNIQTSSIKGLIGISSIEIKLPQKDGLSYFDVIGGCDWDEEHGLNILMHKTRTITFGGIDGNSYWDAIEDNGTYAELKEKNTSKEIPKKYAPNPKYGKLKPSQKFANETYEIGLISGGFNDVFIEGVKKQEIDKNGKWESQNKTYLEAACWYKNNELVEFLLSENAEIRYALHQCFGYNDNPKGFDLILSNGGDINAQDLSGKTILHIVAHELVRLYDHKYQSIEYGWNHETELDEKIELPKHKIKQLLLKGADPKIKDRYQFDIQQLGRNLKEPFKSEYINFIESCGGKPNKSWKFWK